MRLIRNTDTPMRHPWPENVFVQGGARGVVFGADGTDSYRTAFVEASPPNTFLRGEGATVEAAEDACWARYQQMTTCPVHPYHGPFEPRQYRNGAGFCTRCGTWFSRVLPPQPDEGPPPPTFLQRALAGDEQAITKVLSTVADAHADTRPDEPPHAPQPPQPERNPLP